MPQHSVELNWACIGKEFKLQAAHPHIEIPKVYLLGLTLTTSIKIMVMIKILLMILIAIMVIMRVRIITVMMMMMMMTRVIIMTETEIMPILMFSKTVKTRFVFSYSINLFPFLYQNKTFPDCQKKKKNGT